jgi:hypothetical protein
MMKTRIGLVCVLLGALALGTVWADGAGGSFLGYTVGDAEIPGDFHVPGTGESLTYFGGYGYGVARRGVINGGFGLALLDRADDGYAGGIGGFISGLRILRVPFHLALVSWTGLGGVSARDRGYFVAFGELDLELGLPIVPWFMPTVYVGYQVIGNLIPGLPFQQSLTHNAVAGFRISWGDFR